MTFDPTSVEVLCVTLPKDHCVQVPWKYIEVYGYSDPFCKNLNQRSLTPRWPLTPHLLRSHVWLNPRTIVSKSHANTSMYVDTVINFANYHIHTTYYKLHTYILHTAYRISDHIVSLRRDKKRDSWFKHSIEHYEWSELWVSMLVWFLCSEWIDDWRHNIYCCKPNSYLCFQMYKLNNRWQHLVIVPSMICTHNGVGQVHPCIILLDKLKHTCPRTPKTASVKSFCSIATNIVNNIFLLSRFCCSCNCEKEKKHWS